MATPKYKLNINHLEKTGEIAKLERDGFSREQISKTLYKETEGLKQSQRIEIFSKLYERER